MAAHFKRFTKKINQTRTLQQKKKKKKQMEKKTQEEEEQILEAKKEMR